MQIFIPNSNSNISVSESNFVTFSLAFMKVFDLLTLDNWSDFVQDSIKNSIGIIVFLRVFFVISLIFICNFIMVNFFIDLACQHFENLNIKDTMEEKPDLFKSLKSRSLTRLSTTKTRLRILEEELDFDENLSSLSSFDEENFNKLIKKMFIQNTNKKSPNSSENEKTNEQNCSKSLLFSILQDSVTRRISEDNCPKNDEISPKKKMLSPENESTNQKKESFPFSKKDIINSEDSFPKKNDNFPRKQDSFSPKKKDSFHRKQDSFPRKQDDYSPKKQVDFQRKEEISSFEEKKSNKREKNSVDSIFSVDSTPPNFENRLIERMGLSVRNSDVIDNITKHREAKHQNDIVKFLKTVLANFEDEAEFTYLKEVKCQFSLYLFSKENTFRKLCFKILVNRLFYYLMNCVIFLSMLKLIIDSYVDKEDNLKVLSDVLNYFINISFITEAFIKIVAFGLFMDKMSYFRNSVNVFEFINSLGFILLLATNIEILTVFIFLFVFFIFFVFFSFVTKFSHFCY